MLEMSEVDGPGCWPGGKVGCGKSGYCSSFTRGGACANWAVKNVIEHQKKVVLAVEIEVCVLSDNK
jgi:hypothetical protein